MTSRDPASRADRDGGPTVGLFRYALPDGWSVLAGRTDRDNDRLSLKIARANDWWFHVRGQPGSHVVLQVPADREPDRETLRAAAAVAAWHSKLRASRQVAVAATRARYVTKPRGAPAGTVHIRREVTIKVKPGLPAGTSDQPARIIHEGP